MSESDHSELLEINAYVAGMKEFSSAMRSTVALSTAMLVFPITLLKAINPSAAIFTNYWLVGAWALLGLSIMFGIFYQVIAARKIFAKLGNSPI